MYNLLFYRTDSFSECIWLLMIFNWQADTETPPRQNNGSVKQGRT